MYVSFPCLAEKYWDSVMLHPGCCFIRSSMILVDVVQPHEKKKISHKQLNQGVE